ncbi:protein rolling stone-like [Ctenocephalides felis]|uniref:protein rolling stone-like n=1 Tax=Ctenocephalides felis TaxID=7515 RepID=UPI000E6E5730|nr:protein rolling stone-like [Ctenocephalides felis]
MVANNIKSKGEETCLKFLPQKGGILSQSFKLKAYNLEHKKPHVFSQCQWQKTADTSTWYLIYRAVHVAACLVMFFVSGGDPGGLRLKNPNGYYAKWPIYLTHWGITLCVIQSLMALTLVAHRKHEDRESSCNAVERNSANNPSRMTLFAKTYWVLHTLTVNSAIVITAVYWVMVFNPEEGFNVVTVMVHIVNSVVMIIDLFLVAHPVRLLHMHWSLMFAILYLTFSWIYYCAGGLSRKMEPFIYTALDWRKPGISIGFCLFGLVCYVLVHTLVFFLAWLRRLIYLRVVKPQKPDPVHASLLSLPMEVIINNTA